MTYDELNAYPDCPSGAIDCPYYKYAKCTIPDGPEGECDEYDFFTYEDDDDEEDEDE